MSTTTKTAEHLEAARKLLEQGWCQNAFARDEKGTPVSEHSPEAAYFCITGACTRAAARRCDEPETTDRAYQAMLDALTQHLQEQEDSSGLLEKYPICSFNDHPDTTQHETLQIMDLAIASLRD